MGFRTHYSKIWYLCILNILSGKNWRNGRCRKNSLTSSFFLEAGHKTPHEKGILSLGKEHPSLERQRDTKRNPNEQALLHFPQFIMFSSYPFVLSHFFYDLPLFIKPGIKMLMLIHIFGLSFPYEGSCVILNLHAFLWLIHLLLCSPAENLEA